MGRLLVVSSDVQLATKIAQDAGKLLVGLRTEFGPVDPADSARRKELKDSADKAAHEFITAALAEARPGDAVLSEEGVDRTERDTADRVWIVDPLDGTSEYGQGRTDFAVHIALWDRTHAEAGKLLVGVVDLPAQELTYTSADASGRELLLDDSRPIRIVVSRSRPPELVKSGVAELEARLREAGLASHGVEVYSVGSVGVKVSEILAGRADAYLHDTGFYEWDVAAPYAVAQHHGLVASHLDRTEVTFNHRPPWVTNLVVALPQLADYLIS